MKLTGWKFERKTDKLGKLFDDIIVTAPNGYVAVVSNIDRNPANVLHMLASTILNETSNPR